MFGGPDGDHDLFHWVAGAHQRQREQMMVLEAALPYLQNEEKLRQIEDVVDFFKDKVLAHFQWEEKCVFPVSAAMGDPGIKQIVHDLQAEHAAMIKHFDAIVDIVAQHGFHFTDELIHQRFVKTAKTLIQAMLGHADKEDAKLYPFIKEKGIPLKGNPLKP